LSCVRRSRGGLVRYCTHSDRLRWERDAVLKSRLSWVADQRGGASNSPRASHEADTWISPWWRSHWYRHWWELDPIGRVRDFETAYSPPPDGGSNRPRGSQSTAGRYVEKETRGRVPLNPKQQRELPMNRELIRNGALLAVALGLAMALPPTKSEAQPLGPSLSQMQLRTQVPAYEKAQARRRPNSGPRGRRGWRSGRPGITSFGYASRKHWPHKHRH
jgi:hypothetical protein